MWLTESTTIGILYAWKYINYSDKGQTLDKRGLVDYFENGSKQISFCFWLKQFLWFLNSLYTYSSIASIDIMWWKESYARLCQMYLR